MHSLFMLFGILAELRRRGHSAEVISGVSDRIEADAAVLHVDATIVPPEYLDFASRFPFCLNIGATDISKRRVSSALVSAKDDWDGPVIVKSNFNARGMPEFCMNGRARKRGRRPPFPNARVLPEYIVHERLADVPREIFERPDLVVEKFMPERAGDGFAACFWIFCGESERCTRYVSRDPLVKGARVVRSEPMRVPDELRVRRRELGFDYGKFDFVMHDGRAVLLDANKTPGGSPNLASAIAAGTASLADGFEGLIRRS
ncbi:MAG TPA: hypothetical protein VFK19_05580 [Sphingomicrobium sp.]|jgi:hypothetical protein|nr:hypothetical protein [Sphingomicrobium sp.]